MARREETKITIRQRRQCSAGDTVWTRNFHNLSCLSNIFPTVVAAAVMKTEDAYPTHTAQANRPNEMKDRKKLSHTHTLSRTRKIKAEHCNVLEDKHVSTIWFFQKVYVTVCVCSERQHQVLDDVERRKFVVKDATKIEMRKCDREKAKKKESKSRMKHIGNHIKIAEAIFLMNDQMKMSLFAKILKNQNRK